MPAKNSNMDSISKKFSIVILEPFGDGAFIHLLHQLANELSNCGHKIEFWTSTNYELAPFNLPRSYQLRQPFRLGLRFKHFTPPKNKLKKIFWNIKQQLRQLFYAFQLLCEYSYAILLLSRQKPDFVLVGTVSRYPLVVYLLKYLKRNDIAIIQMCHEIELREEKKNPISKLIYQSNQEIYEICNLIFFLSDNLQKQFTARYGEKMKDKIALLPMGNAELFCTLASRRNFRQEFQIDEKTPLIIFFGRVRPDKGVEELLTAFYELLKTKPTCHLAIAGDTPLNYLEKLERQSQELGIEQQVHFHYGYLPLQDVVPFIQTASIAVFPYRTSSQSYALHIPMICGTPIIATDVGGLPEVIIDGKNGLIVPPNNPAALTTALVILLESPDMSQNFAEYGKYLAKTKHSWKQVALLMNDLLQNYYTDI